MYLRHNAKHFYRTKIPSTATKLYLGIYSKYTDSMHSFTTHESRNLKQARPKGQYVDLLRYTLATPSWEFY